MVPVPDTRPSLLVRLGDAHDTIAWRQFAQVYAPLVYALAKRQGLQDADAADVTQDVCRVVAKAIQSLRYDEQNGSFRGWLLTIARRRLQDFWRERQRGPATGTSVRFDELAANTGDRAEVEQWELEYHRQLFATAAASVRNCVEGPTWEAFWRTAVEGQPNQQVADALGISVGTVYVAKSRVMARIKEAVRDLQWE